MYCPKCGQVQASEEVRFCSRCGFPLAAVSDLLLTGGVLPVVRAASDGSAVTTTTAGVSPRRRGVKHGVALLLVSMILVPFIVILHEAIDLPLEFNVLSAFIALAGFLRIIYALFFEDAAPPRLAAPHVAVPQQLYAPPVASPRLNPASQEMLPTAQSSTAYRQPPLNTSEIVNPPSVTDHTTRLLEKQSDTSPG